MKKKKMTANRERVCGGRKNTRCLSLRICLTEKKEDKADDDKKGGKGMGGLKVPLTVDVSHLGFTLQKTK